MSYPVRMQNEWWVTDLNHFVEADPQESKRAQCGIRGYVAEIVKASTALSARLETQTALPCRKPRRECLGHIRVRLQDIPPEVHWRCSHCQEGGVISNWPQSPWDLSAEPPGRAALADSACRVVIDDAQYRELRNLDFMDLESERVVYAAEAVNEGILLRGHSEVFETLLGDVAAHASNESERFRKQRLDRIFSLLDRFLDSLDCDPDDAAGFRSVQESLLDEIAADIPCPAFLPPELVARIESTLASNGFQDAEEINLRFAQMVQEYNKEPQAASAGLSPSQVRRLVNSDWKSPDSAIRLNSMLFEQEARRGRFMQDAIPFLKGVAREGSVKATASGNLNRRFVERMIDILPDSQDWRSRKRELRKVWNEKDFFALHMSRILSELGGLLRCRRGRFELTSKGLRLLEPQRAGELLECLFVACFRKFNLSYVDILPENELLQSTVAFSLRVLMRDAEEWRSTHELSRYLLLPAVRSQIPRVDFTDYAQRQVESRILEPLSGFGLLETRTASRFNRSADSNLEVRKTPLFDRFIRFSL